MASQNVCRYFRFGHCKYKERCRLQHVKEFCENQSCEIRSCSLRHPKACKYFRDYNRCKFGEYCDFKHVEKEITLSSKEIVESHVNGFLL